MTGTARPGTVLVGVDGTAASAAAVRWAAAEAEDRQARLHAVHVVEDQLLDAHGVHHEVPLQLDQARQTVPGRVGGWLFRAGIDVDLAVSVVPGEVGARLAREATDAALVVIGAPDSIHHSALPLDLASRCRCPVVTVGTLGDATYVDAPSGSGTEEPGQPRR